MTNPRLTHYQGLLLDSPRITFSDPVTLNPATLLPDPDLSTPIHDCRDILSKIIQVRADLKDTPLPNCELNWYKNGSSFVQEGVRRAGAAVLTDEGEIVWSAALPPAPQHRRRNLLLSMRPWKEQKASGPTFTQMADMPLALSMSTVPSTEKEDSVPRKERD